MKPTQFYRSDSPTTAHGIIRDLIRVGTDRGCLVRPAQQGRPAAVVIFLLTPKAIREVGPFLRSVLAQLPQKAVNAPLLVDGDSDLPTLLKQMESAGHEWFYTPLQYESAGGLRADAGLLTAIIGPAVTEAFAAELTKLGCICNLK